MPPNPSKPIPNDLFRTWSYDVVEIKQLFFSRKYKRCAAQCEELQISATHPIHLTFLSFYQALSYESLGIAAHNFSTNKLALLERARECFGTALEQLPGPFVVVVDDDDDLADNYCQFKGQNYSPVGKFPACVTLDVMKRYQADSSPLTSTNSEIVSPCESGLSFALKDDESGSGRSRRHNDNGLSRDHSSSTSSTSSTAPNIDEVPDFDAYSSQGDLSDELPVTSIKKSSQSTAYLTTPICTDTLCSGGNSTGTSNHKARLSQSLSSTHCLSDDLIPSPLFRRIRSIGGDSTIAATPSKPPTKQFSQTGSDGFEDVLQHQHRGEESQPSRRNEDNLRTSSPSHNHNDNQSLIHNRPLPPLPFNHKPYFEKRGSRHVLIPTASLSHPNHPDQFPNTAQARSRVSAIQTLVAKFEGKIQQPGSQCTTLSLPISSGLPCGLQSGPNTPVTPRFRMISQVFGRKLKEPPETKASTSRIPIRGRGNGYAGAVEQNNTKLVQCATPAPGLTTPPSPLKGEADAQMQSRLKSSSPGSVSTSASPYPTPALPAPSHSRLSLPSNTPNPALDIAVSSFRACLHNHLTSITARIDNVTRIQQERRATGMKRDMSFWSFDVHNLHSSTTAGDKQVRRRRACPGGIEPCTGRQGVGDGELKEMGLW